MNTIQTHHDASPINQLDRVALKAGAAPTKKSASKLRQATVPVALCTLLLAAQAVPAQAAVSTRYTFTGTVNLRQGPGTSYKYLGQAFAGQTADFTCQQQNGTSINGNRTWNYSIHGFWTSDYYASTQSWNSFQDGLGDCSAATWAVAELNSPDPTWSDRYGHAWSGWCEQFVEQAFGNHWRYASAIANYNDQKAKGRIKTDIAPPKGALVFYAGGGGFGHVGVAMGDGTVISTQGFAGQRLVVKRHAVRGYLSNTYLGWSSPPRWVQ